MTTEWKEEKPRISTQAYIHTFMHIYTEKWRKLNNLPDFGTYKDALRVQRSSHRDHGYVYTQIWNCQ